MTEHMCACSQEEELVLKLMELKKITNAVPQLHFKGSMSTSDQWLSISSPDPSSKVLQGGWSFYLYNSVATLLCILS